MQRNTIGFALIALFTIAIIGIAASSIHSTPLQSGFGIEGGGDEHTGKIKNNSRNPAISSDAGDSGGAGPGSGAGLLGGEGIGTENSTDTSSGSVSSPLVILVALSTVAAVGVALVVWATRGNTAPHTDSDPPATETTTDTDDNHTEPFEPVDLTNEVYRAWWEMARQTNLSHTASRSPSEFAAAAVDAGMNPDAVAELTRLFRATRYGGLSVTNDAEQQATAALDRIHSQSDSSEQETNP